VDQKTLNTILQDISPQDIPKDNPKEIQKNWLALAALKGKR